MATTRTIANPGQPLVRPDASVLVGATMRFLLCDPTGEPTSGFVTDSQEWAASVVSVVTDANGEFSVSLIPNDTISGDTYYFVDTGGAHGYEPFKAKLLSSANPITLIDFFTSGQDLTPAEASALATHISSNSHLSTDERGAIDAANSPAAGNPVATMADLAVASSGESLVGAEVAGEILSGHVGVVAIAGKVYRFDNTNPAHMGTVRGVTLQAALLDDPVNVLYQGQIVNVGWGLSAGPVYLSATGLVTNTAPTTGIMQPIGFAHDADTAVIRIQTPIQK